MQINSSQGVNFSFLFRTAFTLISYVIIYSNDDLKDTFPRAKTSILWSAFTRTSLNVAIKRKVIRNMKTPEQDDDYDIKHTM